MRHTENQISDMLEIILMRDFPVDSVILIHQCKKEPYIVRVWDYTWGSELRVAEITHVC